MFANIVEFVEVYGLIEKHITFGQMRAVPGLNAVLLKFKKALNVIVNVL
jgi:hypothetical protein